MASFRAFLRPVAAVAQHVATVFGDAGAALRTRLQIQIAPKEGIRWEEEASEGNSRYSTNGDKGYVHDINAGLFAKGDRVVLKSQDGVRLEFKTTGFHGIAMTVIDGVDESTSECVLPLDSWACTTGPHGQQIVIARYRQRDVDLLEPVRQPTRMRAGQSIIFLEPRK